MTQQTKSGANRRVIMLRLRVTVAEKTLLASRSLSAGMTLSDWVRMKAIDTKPIGPSKVKPEQEPFLRILAQLGKCGSNLNQIARQLNRKSDNAEFEVPVAEIVRLLQEFKMISQELRALLHGNHKG